MYVCTIWLFYTFGYLIFVLYVYLFSISIKSMQMQYAKYPQKPKRIRILNTRKMHNQSTQQNPKNQNHTHQPNPNKPHNKNNNNNTILRTLGCVGSRCRWFINRPPPTHHTNLDAIYRWLTTKTRMSKRSCWARRACAPISRAKIWSLGKYCKIHELVDHSAAQKKKNRTTNQIQQWKTKLSICSYQKTKWKPNKMLSKMIKKKSLKVIQKPNPTRSLALSCSHSSMALGSIISVQLCFLSQSICITYYYCALSMIVCVCVWVWLCIH